MTRHLTPSRLAAVSTAIVFVAAFVISWDSLRVLALAAGVQTLLAPLYPVTIDSLMVTGTVAAVALRSAPMRTRLYTWALIAAGIAVSVLGNGVHSQAHGGILELPWWAAAAASAVPALSLAASLHLLVIVLRHAHTEATIVAPVVQIVEETAQDRPQETERETVPARPRETPTRPARGDTRRRVARLIRSNPDITAAAAAKRLGLSRGHAHRLLTEARRPRVVEQALS